MLTILTQVPHSLPPDHLNMLFIEGLQGGRQRASEPSTKPPGSSKGSTVVRLVTRCWAAGDFQPRPQKLERGLEVHFFSAGTPKLTVGAEKTLDEKSAIALLPLKNWLQPREIARRNRGWK